MSSEQRYDSYEQLYEQFVNDGPCLYLPGELTETSTSNFSTYENQQDCLINPQQAESSFSNDASNFDQNQPFQTGGNLAQHSQLDISAYASNTGNFPSLDYGATATGVGVLGFGTGGVRDQDGEFQPFPLTASNSLIEFGEIEARQPSTWGVSLTDFGTAYNGVVHQGFLDVSPTEPIDVSFFF